MKPLTDEYILSEESQIKEYGFETFKHADNDHYYFLFNDKDGEPVLFSQGYTKANSRDNGVKSVLKNAAISDRFEIIKEGEVGDKTFYLLLKAGNHQQIARSRTVNTLRDINKLQDMLMTIGAEAPVNDRDDTSKETKEMATTKIVESKPVEMPVKEKVALEIKPKKKAVSSTRQLFHVMVYSDNGTCKVEHVLSGESHVSPYLNGKEIESFIMDHLPDEYGSRFNQEKVSRGIEALSPFEKSIRSAAPVPASVLEANPVATVSNISAEVDKVEQLLQAQVGADEENSPATSTDISDSFPLNEDIPPVDSDFSFQDFLQEDGRLPELITETPGFKRNEVLAVLRTPVPASNPDEDEKDMVNRFVESRGSTVNGNGKNGKSNDVVSSFVNAKASIQQFLQGTDKRETNRNLEELEDVMHNDEKNEAAIDDVVKDFIEKGGQGEKNTSKKAISFAEFQYVFGSENPTSKKSLTFEETIGKPCTSCS